MATSKNGAAADKPEETPVGTTEPSGETAAAPAEETQNETVTEANKPRSASEALKASDEKTLAEEEGRKRAAEVRARAESEENLNWGQIAKEPIVVDAPKEKTTVVGEDGTEEAVVKIASFSVIDEKGIHHSFKKGDRIKVSKEAYDRGVSLGAFKQ